MSIGVCTAYWFSVGNKEQCVNMCQYVYVYLYIYIYIYTDRV